MQPNADSTVNTNNNTSPDPQSMDFMDIWGITRRRKGLIIFGVVLGIGLSCLYYFSATPIYESSVQMLVVPKNSSLPQIQGAASADSVDYSMQADVLSTQIELIRSQVVLAHAVDLGGLAALPTFVELTKQGMNPVGFIVENLKVSKGGEGAGKEASVLRASFRSPYPEDSQKVVDAIVESYQKFLEKTYHNTNSEALGLISKIKNELWEDLGTQEKEYAEWRESQPFIWGEGSPNLHQVRLSTIEEKLGEIADRHFEVKARLAVIQETLAKGTDQTDMDLMTLLGETDKDRLTTLVNLLKGDPYSQKFQADAPARSALAMAKFDKGLALRMEQLRLLEKFAQDHPAIQSIQNQIDEIDKFLDENRLSETEEPEFEIDPRILLVAYVRMLKQDLSGMEKQRAARQEAADHEEAAAKNFTVLEIKDETYRNSKKRTNDLYEETLDRLKEVELITDYGGYLTEVLSPARPAIEPAWPKLPLVLGLGIGFGGMFGIGLAWLVDAADRTFRNPEELCHALDLPIMSHLPSLSAATGKGAEGNGDSPIDNTVVAYSRPKGRNAEAFRGLRTCLFFNAHSKSQKVIQVTSPNPGDGKTTVAANLGVSIAQAGKKVLLIDCDFRRPRLSKLLGVNSEIGMSTALQDEVELFDAIHGTGIENLSVLPCGKRPPNPAELLTSPRFAALTNVLREKFDFVIMDTPPVLAVSDASIVASQVDGVMMVVRITKNGRPQTVRAKDMLASLDSELLGVVVNGVAEDRNKTYSYGYASAGYRYHYDRYRYGSRYRYGYGYGYGYGEGYGDKNGNGYLDAEETSGPEESSAGQNLRSGSDS